MKISIKLFVVSIKNLKTLKYHTFSKKKLVLSFVVSVALKLCLKKTN